MDIDKICAAILIANALKRKRGEKMKEKSVFGSRIG